MTPPGSQYSLFENLEPVPTQAPLAAPVAGRFSDYVVYVDESGDHSLASIDAGYPVFVLALCVFHKRHYSERIIPAVEKLKFNYFGHDSVVLHETDVFAPLIDRAIVLREGRVAQDGVLEAHEHGHETEPPARSVRIIEEVRPWK